MLEQVKRHLDALAAADWDTYKAQLAPDAVYEEAATMTRVKGADAYLSAIKSWKRAFPDLHANVMHAFWSGNAIMLEVEWEGTHQGLLSGPLGMISPTGKHGAIRAVMIFIVDDDKIIECRHYFDLLTMLRQLGVAPVITPAKGPRSHEARPRH